MIIYVQQVPIHFTLFERRIKVERACDERPHKLLKYLI